MNHHDEESGPRAYYRRSGSRGREHADREWSRPEREERGFAERAGDEVRSWFGDEEAERRRRRDERLEDRGGRERSWEPERDFDDRRWARQWGYLEGRREPRHGDEWRPGGRERGPEEPWGGRSWTGEPTRGSAPWYRGEVMPERSWAGRMRDEPRGGRHSGKGPRNYQRSDERIRDEVCERLACSGEVDASDIDIQVRDGEVTLAGRVASRFEKREAEDLAESVWGVKEIHNQLRVGAPGEEAGASRPSAQGEWQPRVA